MADVTFPDGFDAPDRIAFGLAAPQLLVAVSGAAIAYLAIASSTPALVRWPLAAIVAALASALAWGRWQQRPLLAWAWLGVHYAVRPHPGTLLLAASGDDTSPPPGMAAPHASGPDEPEWAQWLHHKPTPKRSEATDRYPEGDAPEDATSAVADLTTSDAAGVAEQLSSDDDDEDPGQISGIRPLTVELKRTPLVLLPSPAVDDDVLPDGDLELDDASPAILPLSQPARWPDEVKSGVPALVADIVDVDVDAGALRHTEQAPMFLGATRRLTFFSLNGGSGRTTLATEVACLLAAQGRHRRGPGEPEQRLRVALLDLDLRSATVSVHLGIPQPTVWDFIVSGHDNADRIADYMVSHPSGLRALLGPPKPLSTAGAALEPARVAEIVHQLERDGTHFIIIDISGDLNAVTTWVLSAVHDIYVVLTPTASGVQDAYRTTEALRRQGLGSKLRYVVNRARGSNELSETMGDLGGKIVATIPYDTAIEDAENRHRIASLGSASPGVDGIQQLAAHIYPGIACARTERRLNRLLRWRRAG